MHRAFRRASTGLVLLAGIAGCGRDVEDAVRQEIRTRLASAKPPAYAGGASWRLVRQVYQDQEERPLWSKGGRPLTKARELVASICDAEGEGLRPADYHLEELRDAVRALKARDRAEAGDIAALDIRLTAMMLAFGADLLGGRLDPRTVDDGWYLRARRSSVDSTLRAAFREKGFPDMLDELSPRQKEYRDLVEALKDYRELARKGGWPQVPAGKPLERGARGERVAALRQRLRATGELDAPESAEPIFDDKVARAVARFRVRHGLPADSIVEAATLSALNVPVETRILQIEVNLDRYRWLPAEFEKRYLLVNIPDFRLYGYERGKEKLEQRVIVGDEYQNATPVFADSMTYLVFRPEWNVP